MLDESPFERFDLFSCLNSKLSRAFRIHKSNTAVHRLARLSFFNAHAFSISKLLVGPCGDLCILNIPELRMLRDHTWSKQADHRRLEDDQHKDVAEDT